MLFSKTLYLLGLLGCIADAASLSSRVKSHRPPEREKKSAFEGLEGGDEDNANFEDIFTGEDSIYNFDNEVGSVATEEVEQLYSTRALLQETAFHSQGQFSRGYVLNRVGGSTEIKRASTKTLPQIFLGEQKYNDRVENQDQPTPSTMMDLLASAFDDEKSEGDTAASPGALLRSSRARQPRNGNGSRQQVQCRCEYPDENVYPGSGGGGAPPSSTSSSALDSLGIFQNRPRNGNNDSIRSVAIRKVFNWRRLGQAKKNVEKFEGSRKLTARGSIDASDLRIVNGERILSRHCWTCQGVQYRCPGQTINCPLWDMQCILPVNTDNSVGRGASYGMGKGMGKSGRTGGKSGKTGGKSGKKRRGLLFEDDSSVDEGSSERVSMRSVLAPRSLRRISDHSASGRDLRIFNHRKPNEQVGYGGILYGFKTSYRENDPRASTNGAFTVSDNLDSILRDIKAPNRRDDLVEDLRGGGDHSGGGGSCNGNCGGNFDSCRTVMLPASHPRCNYQRTPDPPTPIVPDRTPDPAIPTEPSTSKPTLAPSNLAIPNFETTEMPSSLPPAPTPTSAPVSLRFPTICCPVESPFD